MLKRACNFIQIKKILKDKCKCPTKCLEKFTFKKVRELRINFWSQPKHMRFFHLKNVINLKTSVGRFSYLRTATGESVCKKAFMSVYMINKNFLTKASVLKGKTVGLTQVKEQSTKTLELISWFEEYLLFHGDFMPHNQDVLLPYGTIKIHIYEQYREEACGGHVSKSTFFEIWNKHFPHVKVKKVIFMLIWSSYWHLLI
jgi:hypothetical protein